MMERLLGDLQKNHTERLRWLVCKRLGISPSGLKDEDVIKCGLHMIIDKRRAEAEFASNSAFDEESFHDFMRGEGDE